MEGDHRQRRMVNIYIGLGFRFDDIEAKQHDTPAVRLRKPVDLKYDRVVRIYIDGSYDDKHERV